MGIWVLTAFADVRQVLKDPRFATDPVPERMASKSQYLREHGQPDLEALVQNSQRFLFYLNPRSTLECGGWWGEPFTGVQSGWGGWCRKPWINCFPLTCKQGIWR
ncbi:MAG: hypothetical protein HC921_11260 [Synechococcaceae cyanobacterium SM2_3_1]|nr:hypothetical protein [Synechococcaceae cyanobacterium SM2_3_1]